MPQPVLPEVFTITEVARAVGVPAAAVRSLIERGELSFIGGSRFLAIGDPPRAGRRLRETALTLPAPSSRSLFAPAVAGQDMRKPALFSFAAHALLVLGAVWLSSGRIETAPLDERVHDEAHLVFLLSPGPGGGGGGGGLHQRRPAPKIARRGDSRLEISVPATSETPVVTTARDDTPKPASTEPVIQPPPAPAPEPVPAKVLVAPVQVVAADNREQEGALEHNIEGADSHGPGANGGVGTGEGTGNGPGLGSGIGPGEGGGIGDGPRRPGNGVLPPRLLREVKAEYTEEARRRGLTGDVLLEVIVRRDGTVGAVRVLQGLGSGLDERAITAVRQWRFDPGRSKNVPVDVVVEVAVEFRLR